MKRQVLCDLFEFTPKTLYNWRQEGRSAIELIEKYFTEEDLQEFLQTKKMKKLENVELYAQYEKKIMDEIRHIVTASDRDYKVASSLFVYQFIDVVGKKYFSLKKEYIKAQEKEKFTASSYCEPDDYDFTDILVEEFDKINDLIRLKMMPITVDEFIKKSIFNIDDFADYYVIPNFYPDLFHYHFIEKTTFYVQSVIVELYDKELLSFALAHIETFLEEGNSY